MHIKRGLYSVLIFFYLFSLNASTCCFPRPVGLMEHLSTATQKKKNSSFANSAVLKAAQVITLWKKNPEYGR